MKKEGFGAGKWNGAGGKLNLGESPEAAARRETKEEFVVDPTDVSPVGTLEFRWLGRPAADHLVHVFIVRAWSGTPTETSEMRPQWFPVSEIPYDTMWPADPYWLPTVLNGKNVQAYFTYRADGTLADHHAEESER